MTWKQRITAQIERRIPELKGNDDLLGDYLNSAFKAIMRHTAANKYSPEWDDVLVTAVVMLYNYSGVEGSIERENGGVHDYYESSVILSPLLARSDLPHYIRPLGYAFAADRFVLPED